MRDAYTDKSLNDKLKAYGLEIDQDESSSNRLLLKDKDGKVVADLWAELGTPVHIPIILSEDNHENN